MKCHPLIALIKQKLHLNVQFKIEFLYVLKPIWHWQWQTLNHLKNPYNETQIPVNRTYSYDVEVVVVTKRL